MGLRTRFPLDLAYLLSPLPLIVAAVFGSLFFRITWWLVYPTPQAWLGILGFAFTTALTGALLLLWAKLPQYRAGIFFRVGCRQLPPLHQRLYRLAFRLIVPSLIVVSVMLLTAKAFR